MTDKQTKVDIPSAFSCLLWADAETNRWLAHCLDFDLVTSGKTEQDAWKHLLRVVKMHVEHCFTHRQEGLAHKADAIQWSVFEKLKAASEYIRSEKISLTLVPEQIENDLKNFFWIQGVEANSTADIVQRIN